MISFYDENWNYRLIKWWNQQRGNYYFWEWSFSQVEEKRKYKHMQCTIDIVFSTDTQCRVNFMLGFDIFQCILRWRVIEHIHELFYQKIPFMIFGIEYYFCFDIDCRVAALRWAGERSDKSVHHISRKTHHGEIYQTAISGFWKLVNNEERRFIQ